MVTYYKPRLENGTNELITREHYLHIPVTCYLERTQVLEESFLPKGDLYVSGEEGYGEFSLNLDRYTNSGFYQPAKDSGEVMLGTPLYFGVRLTSVTNLTLLIESCWATSSPDPRDDHRYDIIENGCAVDSTTVIYNWASSTFKRFSIDAFTFIGGYDKVYVHCSILICDNNDSGSRCAQGCLARSRRSLLPTGSRSKPHTITIGPISDAQRSQRAMLINTIDDGPESHDPLMIVAVSALCVLIALTVIMALMMVRMRRRRPELTGYRRVGITEQDAERKRGE
ncbi:ZP domain-containing protein [Strongylocentrotus purpuratus]|uniref:ZP domain-containing protein n=1 Tax=Strongylocentrotus purpuratus TaxID=7668 RepID=A0A7M7PMU5_STRPU|nr:ZP domain-containing protein [Strongylocentrotus purpuratus]